VDGGPRWSDQGETCKDLTIQKLWTLFKERGSRRFPRGPKKRLHPTFPTRAETDRNGIFNHFYAFLKTLATNTTDCQLCCHQLSPIDLDVQTDEHARAFPLLTSHMFFLSVSSMFNAFWKRWLLSRRAGLWFGMDACPGMLLVLLHFSRFILICL
jgi:hypothetical protein